MNRIYRIGTVRFFRTHFVHSVNSVCKTKKAMRGKNPPSPRLRRGSNERIDIFEGVARLIKFCELRGQGAHGSDQPPVRLGLLASFGGITRIRFKGSPAPVLPTNFFAPSYAASKTGAGLSAIRLPRNLSREATARRAEVNA